MRIEEKNGKFYVPVINIGAMQIDFFFSPETKSGIDWYIGPFQYNKDALNIVNKIRDSINALLAIDIKQKYDSPYLWCHYTLKTDSKYDTFEGDVGSISLGLFYSVYFKIKYDVLINYDAVVITGSFHLDGGGKIVLDNVNDIQKKLEIAKNSFDNDKKVAFIYVSNDEINPKDLIGFENIDALRIKEFDEIDKILIEVDRKPDRRKSDISIESIRSRINYLFSKHIDRYDEALDFEKMKNVYKPFKTETVNPGILKFRNSAAYYNLSDIDDRELFIKYAKLNLICNIKKNILMNLNNISDQGLLDECSRFIEYYHAIFAQNLLSMYKEIKCEKYKIIEDMAYNNKFDEIFIKKNIFKIQIVELYIVWREYIESGEAFNRIRYHLNNIYDNFLEMGNNLDNFYKYKKNDGSPVGIFNIVCETGELYDIIQTYIPKINSALDSIKNEQTLLNSDEKKANFLVVLNRFADAYSERFSIKKPLSGFKLDVKTNIDILNEILNKNINDSVDIASRHTLPE